MCVSCLLWCLRLQTPYARTHTCVLCGPLGSFIINTYTVAHIWGKPAILGSSSPSSHPARIYSRQLFSGPGASTSPSSLMQLPACFSLYPIIIPQKASVGLRNSQSRNTMAARREAEAISHFDECAHICGRFPL